MKHIEPSSEIEPKPRWPQVGSVVQVVAESSATYSDNDWLILEPFQETLGKIKTIALPLDENGNALTVGGTLDLDQVKKTMRTMTPEDIISTYENAFHQRGYKLPHEHFVKSVNEAFELQDEINN